MMDLGMKDSLVHTLKEQEGFRSKPYRCTEGYLTIGYGRNLDTVGLSMDESAGLLENDVVKAYNTLISNQDWIADLPKPAQAALTNMCFQLGYFGLMKFKKMLAACKDQDWDEAKVQAMDSRWNEQTPNRCAWVCEQFEACK